MAGKHLAPEVRRATLGDAFVPRRLQWAVAEASRCLQCEPAPCQDGCPAGVDVRRFVRALRTRNVRQAVAVIRERNPLVATCGRVCPQGELCERRCNASGLARPIAIGELQRFVGEAAVRERIRPVFPEARSRGEVAIVGGGPAGLAAAWFLRGAGVAVDLYERRAGLGGVPMSSLPRFRLPRELLRAELAFVEESGIRVVHEQVEDVAALAGRYRAVLWAAGLGAPLRLSVPGEELDGVHAALALLERSAGDQPPAFTGTAVVVGGGNTAFDAATTALRLGAGRAIVAYRRTEAEMPAWEEHRRFALEEGVEVRTLLVPRRILGVEGRVAAIELQPAALGEPDGSGRRRPVPLEGDPVTIECRQVVVALGSRPVDGAPGPAAVDADTLATGIAGVYAAGDLWRGGATVVQAVADGRRAAAAIARRLLGDAGV